MKVPEFIPFHFDKFTANLFKKYGAVGVGRWCMVRKAVAEMPTLTIDLNNIFDRESLELDSGCSDVELRELLDHAAQRGMIDPNLYAFGILWIENLDTDLGRFFTAGKRHLPKRPELHGRIPISSADLQEKLPEVTPTSEQKGQNSGIPTHERNETNVTIQTNELLQKKSSEETEEESFGPWRYLKVRKSIDMNVLVVRYTYVDHEVVGGNWELWLLANHHKDWENRDVGQMWRRFESYLRIANENAKESAQRRAEFKSKPPSTSFKEQEEEKLRQQQKASMKINQEFD